MPTKPKPAQARKAEPKPQPTADLQLVIEVPRQVLPPAETKVVSIADAMEDDYDERLRIAVNSTLNILTDLSGWFVEYIAFVDARFKVLEQRNTAPVPAPAGEPSSRR